MHRSLIGAILSAAVVGAVVSSPASGQTSRPKLTDEIDCSFDRDALLALDQHAFDQDMNGGWRAIARREPCVEVAADLIRDYRKTWNLEAGILYWHEGQLRATAGQTEEAIELFGRARHAVADDHFGWNLYVDATITFLKQDEASLLRARDALAELPRPADWEVSDPSGNPIPWPPNLNVVDMLIACFGQPYKEAYGNCKK